MKLPLEQTNEQHDSAEEIERRSTKHAQGGPMRNQYIRAPRSVGCCVRESYTARTVFASSETIDSTHDLFEATLANETLLLTPWFDGRVQPVHEGVYARRAPAGKYSCFSGDRWFGDADTPASAAVSDMASARQYVGWRGLTTAPAEPCGTCRGHTVVDRGVAAESGTDLIEECPDC